MPRFHFNVYDGFGPIDHEGTELPDRQAAETMAIHHVGEILRDDAVRITPGQDWRMELTDGAGLILLRLDVGVMRSAAVDRPRAPPSWPD